MNTLLAILDYIIISYIFYNLFKQTNNYNSWVAWIPIYRFYMLFKEYHLRVYKRDYSKVFIVLTVISFIMTIFVITLSRDILGLSITGAFEGKSYFARIIFFSLSIIIIENTISIFAFIPMLKTKLYKVLFIFINVMYIFVAYYYMTVIFTDFSNVIDNGLINSAAVTEIENRASQIPQYIGNLYSLVILIILLIINKKQMDEVKNGISGIYPKVPFYKLAEDKDIIKKRHYYLFRDLD